MRHALRPTAIDDAGAVVGQWEAPGAAGPYRPVVGSCV
jgi:hypothetical protein